MLSNYGYGLTDNSPNAPWNEPGPPPERDFDITCSQSLSKTIIVTTNNYIPGASGVDYEVDDEGQCYASSWHEEDDTSDTNWADEYDECGHYTPLQLIRFYKQDLKELLQTQKNSEDQSYATKREIKRIEHLIEECEGWSEDEIEFIEE